MANFPTSKDDATSLPNPQATDKQNSPDHASLHTAENAAIIAVETKVGTGSSTPASNTLLFGTGAGTSAWQSLTSAQLAATLSDETGTGSAVFANTPTLITPKVDTINENTGGNGVTVGGVNLKSGAITTAGSVGTTNLATGIQIADKAKNPYKFSVYLNTTQTSIAANTPVKVLFDTKRFDTGSNFDVVTNRRFTAPIAGFYQFNAQVQIGDGGITNTVGAFIVLYVNGVEYWRSQQQIGSSTTAEIVRPSIGGLVQLSANDYVEIYAQIGETGRNLTSGTNVTYFTGYLVSAT